jgi:hypothetical protein
MIRIDNTLLSEDIFEKRFVCDLNACKGACCVEGSSGAPLDEDELDILDAIYDKVKPYMRPEGIEAVESQGTYIKDIDGEFVTPLVNEAECAYVWFDENGIAKCAIEKAYRQGDISFAKPISCHLYPIRLVKLSEYIALNYHKWEICAPACTCGEALNVRVLHFLKEPLLRKFGKEWYEKALKTCNEWLKTS